MDKAEIIALSYLPPRLRNAVKSSPALSDTAINELRLRAGRMMSATVHDRNIRLGVICTPEEIGYVVSSLSDGSLYSVAEEILDGVITTKHGIRAGVCGRASVRNGKIESVRDITSVSIRIPHRVKNAADSLLPLVLKYGSVLVFSRPGGGKTTVLRELIPLLTDTGINRRVAVIDTRYELTPMLDESGIYDVFLGYPRYEGISSAVRSLSPEYIICDEISSDKDADAIMLAHSAGVGTVCSAHAGSTADLYSNSGISRLINAGVFGCICKITKNGCEVAEIDCSGDN